MLSTIFGSSGSRLVVGVGDRLRLALRTCILFSGIIFLSLAITVGGDARFLWRTMSTRPAMTRAVLGSALGLLISWAHGSEAPSSWGSHAHPLVSCFSSLVLFVSLVVISLVVISLVVLCLQSHAHKCRNQSHGNELTCKCREHERR